MADELLQFKECETCHKKSGTVTLCESCQHNRRAIDLLSSQVRLHELEAQMKQIKERLIKHGVSP